MSKICGVRTAVGAAACVAVQAEFAGLNFVPTSKRRVGPVLAKRLVVALASVVPVGVFADQPVHQILATVRDVGLGWVQLHGDEGPEICARLRDEGLRVIKALSAPELDRAAEYAGLVDALLVDGRTPGSGAEWDWTQLASLEPLAVPLWLAGGLNPNNVSAAIAATNPALVDVASGVELAGRMHPQRVIAFVRAARGAVS
jgi:phosphoribosylanthranilate isomerase